MHKLLLVESGFLLLDKISSSFVIKKNNIVATSAETGRLVVTTVMPSSCWQFLPAV